MEFYDYKVKTRDGEKLDLGMLKGKVVLVVNTATGCGFTPQYEALETLYEKYHDKGLEILDFPCDQFGHQVKRFSPDYKPEKFEEAIEGLVNK